MNKARGAFNVAIKDYRISVGLDGPIIYKTYRAAPIHKNPPNAPRLNIK